MRQPMQLEPSGLNSLARKVAEYLGPQNLRRFRLIQYRYGAVAADEIDADYREDQGHGLRLLCGISGMNSVVVVD